MEDTLNTLIAAAVLALTHVGGRALDRFPAVPRTAWLSAASGVSVAYVFVHLLPEIAYAQQALDEATGVLPGLERHAWVLALVGLTVFYVLQQLAQRERTEDGVTTDRVGRLHIISYAAYNGLVGYLLHEQAERAGSALALFTLAMVLHFLVNDHGLRADHGRLYQRVGRYVLAMSVLAGWAVGAVATLTEAAIGLPLAFLGGSIVLNVMKEELPGDRRSRLTPFVLGAAAYAVLLLTV